MIALLNEIMSQVQEFASKNPVVAGAISLWGLSVVTFIFKGVPSRILAFLYRETTTSLSINSQDVVYYQFLNWVSKKKMHSFVRTLNFNNARWGTSETMMSIGYGKSMFFYKKHFFIFNRYRDSSNQSNYVREIIDVRVFGRNQDVFSDLFKEIMKKNDDSMLNIYRYKDGRWELLVKNFKRPLRTVIVDSLNRKAILDHIQTFRESKQWYMDHGIPYHTGILLSGPSGTGKTSLIKGICSYFDKELYLINLGLMSETGLQDALSSVPMDAIVAIEDIDAMGVNLNRQSSGTDGSISDKIEDRTASISGILNAIDGAASSESRILIATTNYPDRLDDALVRDGRFDLKLEIGYVTNEMFLEYLQQFDSTYQLPTGFRIKDKTPMCVVQTQVRKNATNLDIVTAMFNAN